MVEGEDFLMKWEYQNKLSQQGECVYSAQLRKGRILFSASMFILIERQTWLLKMVEK